MKKIISLFTSCYDPSLGKERLNKFPCDFSIIEQEQFLEHLQNCPYCAEMLELHEKISNTLRKELSENSINNEKSENNNNNWIQECFAIASKTREKSRSYFMDNIEDDIIETYSIYIGERRIESLSFSINTPESIIEIDSPGKYFLVDSQNNRIEIGDIDENHIRLSTDQIRAQLESMTTLNDIKGKELSIKHTDFPKTIREFGIIVELLTGLHSTRLRLSKIK